MADELKMKVTLEDGVSPAAKAGADALVKLQTGLRESAEALRGVETEQGRETATSLTAATALSALVVAMKSLADEEHHIGEEGKKGEENAGMFGELLKFEAAKEGVKILAELGEKIADVGFEAIEHVTEVADVNEKLTATFEALGDVPGRGKATLDFLNDLSTKLPQSRDQLAQWTKQYEAMGKTDLGELQSELIATASAQAIMGDSGAEAYKKIQERVSLAVEAHHGLQLAEKSLRSLYDAGVNETDIAKRLGITVQEMATQLKAGTVDAEEFGKALRESITEKGEEPLKAMSNELGTLKEKAIETFDHLLDGIDTSVLTDALKDLIQLGDQAGTSGTALKKGIGPAIQDLVDDVGIAAEEFKGWFLDLEIGWVKSGVTLQTFVTDVKDLGEAASIAIKPFVWLAETGVAAFNAATHAVGAAIFAISDNDANQAAKDRAVQANGGHALPAHADGGMVTSIHDGIALTRRLAANDDGGVVAAPGEGLASVGKGEIILPAGRTVSPSSASPANDNATGGTTIHVDSLTVNIDAPHGVTDAKELTVTSLTIALERLQLAVGR